MSRYSLLRHEEHEFEYAPAAEEEQESWPAVEPVPEAEPLFDIAARQLQPLRISTRDGDAGIAACTVCGHERADQEARANNAAMVQAAREHFERKGTMARVEAEGWLKVWFGERECVWCAECTQFSGECCAVPPTRAGTRRRLFAMRVQAVTYLGKRYEGAAIVQAGKLAEFYAAVLSGDVVLHTECACTGGTTCDSRTRPCCHASPTGCLIPRPCFPPGSGSGAGAPPPATPVPHPASTAGSGSASAAAASKARSIVRGLSRRLSAALAVPPHADELTPVSGEATR